MCLNMEPKFQGAGSNNPISDSCVLWENVQDWALLGGAQDTVQVRTEAGRGEPPRHSLAAEHGLCWQHVHRVQAGNWQGVF